MHLRSLQLSLALLTTTALGAQDLPKLSPTSINGVSQGVSVSVQTFEVSDHRVFALVGPMMVDLESHSVRSPRFELRVQQANGEIVTVDPGPVRTYRGEVLGLTGSKVAGSLLDDGFHARIVTKAGDDYWVQPDRSPGAPDGQHLLYRADDAAMTMAACGTDSLPNAQIGQRVYSPGGTVVAAAAEVAELACDADYEYYADYGFSSVNVTNRIESVINTMNLQYESEVNISHDIVSTTVRTSAGSQPYTSSDAVTLLNQMRSEWNSNQGGVARDIAHLFTGKSIIGGTIGIAWVGVICNGSYGYGLVESDFNNNFACATDLSAHELGHNWNAQHCGCRRNTMNSSITCANSFHERRTRPTIRAFRDSLSCLGGPTGNPTSVEASVVTSTPGAGKGRKRARAVVTITDNLGTPVAGASVTGSFTAGIIEGPFTLSTNSSGVATFETSGTIKGKFTATFCVTAVSAPLPWSQGSSVCDSN